MKFSTFHLYRQPAGWSEQQTYDYENQVILWADELGFDTAWIAEHHFRDYGIVPNTMLLMANLAARTRRVRFGNAVVIMPFHHPLRVAEDAAMMDLLSGGRLNFGFGRGYQGVEFTAFEVSMDDTREKTDEALEVILKAWEGKPFSHHGKYWHFDNVKVVPSPVQKPHPPLFYASISPDSIRHNARTGVPFITDSSIKFDTLKESVQMWRAVAREHGHDPNANRHATMRAIYVGETNEKAREFARLQSTSLPFARAYNPHKEGRTRDEVYARESAPIDPRTGRVARGYEYWEKGYLGRSLSEFQLGTDESWEERWVAGDLDRVIGKLKMLEEIGIGEVLCTLAHADPRIGQMPRMPLRDMYGYMERFARDVMPHFEEKAPVKAK